MLQAPNVFFKVGKITLSAWMFTRNSYLPLKLCTKKVADEFGCEEKSCFHLTYFPAMPCSPEHGVVIFAIIIWFFSFWEWRIVIRTFLSRHFSLFPCISRFIKKKNQVSRNNKWSCVTGVLLTAVTEGFTESLQSSVSTQQHCSSLWSSANGGAAHKHKNTSLRTKKSFAPLITLRWENVCTILKTITRNDLWA